MAEFSVEIEPEALYAAGWHREDRDCDHDGCLSPEDFPDDYTDVLIPVLEEMHAALHPEVSSIDRCLASPCNRLPKLPKPEPPQRFRAARSTLVMP